MVKTMARRPAVASRRPSQVPRPARPAWRRLRRARYSPAKAPRKGPRTTPGREKKRPTTPPRTAPKTARPLAPTRRAPWRVAQSSMAKEHRVSSASNDSVTGPTRWKPSIQAPTRSPRKTSGAPGSSGSTVPTRPAATSRPASSHSGARSSALGGTTAKTATRTASQPAAIGSAPRIAEPGRGLDAGLAAGDPIVEPIEAAAVQAPVREVVVVRDDAAGRHLAEPPQAAGHQGGRTVGDGRRQGEGAQAAPVRQQVALGEPGVDRRGAVAQHAAAEGLEPAAPAARALVGIRTPAVSPRPGVRP